MYLAIAAVYLMDLCTALPHARKASIVVRPYSALTVMDKRMSHENDAYARQITWSTNESIWSQMQKTSQFLFHPPLGIGRRVELPRRRLLQRGVAAFEALYLWAEVVVKKKLDSSLGVRRYQTVHR